MRNFKHKLYFAKTIIFFSIFIFGCTETSVNKNINSENDKYSDFPVYVKYAKHFKINQKENYKELIVLNPWANDTLGYYVLHRKDITMNTDSFNKAILIEIPIKDIGCLSATQIGALSLLNLHDRITGVTNGSQIYDSIVSERFNKGLIKEIGRQMSTNIEQTIALSPDILMKAGYDNVRNEDIRLHEIGLPVVYNIEWMEEDLLARAEWIKFIAAFFCKDKEADSIFSSIELRYNEALKIANKATFHPKVLIGIDYKSSWHLAGENSYVAKMIKDAGATFIANGETGRTPLNFEQVLKIHAEDDIWLNWMHQGISSLDVLEKSNERYTLFKAFQNKQVYNHDKRLNKFGGNDFWESGVSNPDLLLKDLIKIFHPELLPDYEMVYWRKLPEK